MPYISQIKVRNHYRIDDLTIDLVDRDGQWRHLVLTGPTGAGKTTIVDRIAFALRQSVQRKRPAWDCSGLAEQAAAAAKALEQAQADGASQADLLDVRRGAEGRHGAANEFGVELSWTDGSDYTDLAVHFGLELDLDLKSTEQLRRLAALRDTDQRTEQEQREFEALAERLRRTSHPLALEVWNTLQFGRLSARG